MNNYFDMLGQNVPNEEKKEESQEMVNLTVRADAECAVFCDGDFLFTLEAGKLEKTQAPAGQHLLEFKSLEDDNIVVEKEVDFSDVKKNYLVIVRELSALIEQKKAEEARRKAEELANSEPYAVYENGTLTFYFDTQKSNRGGMGFEFQKDEFCIHVYKWHEYCESIKTVIFDDSFSNCHCIESTGFWFYNFWNLTLIRGLNNLDTSNVKNMGWMFRCCSFLQSLDMSGFDTSKVEDMSYMFWNCSSLQSLDLSRFDTSNVKNMGFMFSDCSSLQSLDMSGFDTSKVGDMSCMFNGCSSLQSLDMSGFDTSKVWDMSYMFNGCSSLQSLDLSGFDTSKVGRREGIFEGIDDSKIKGWE